MAKVRMPEKTQAKYNEISEGLAKLGFKEGRDFSIFNATGKWKVLLTPTAVERLTLLVEEGIQNYAELFPTISSEDVRKRFLNEKEK